MRSNASRTWHLLARELVATDHRRGMNFLLDQLISILQQFGSNDDLEGDGH